MNPDPYGFSRDFRRILGFVLFLIVAGCAIAYWLSGGGPVPELITSLP